MLTAAADTLLFSRQRTYDSLKNISQEQWLLQPDGFANNIAWNVGHLAIAQQTLVYVRAGARLALSKETIAKMRPMFGKDTSPADWEHAPDKDEILGIFIAGAQSMADDIKAGLFDTYVMPTASVPYGPAPSMGHIFLLNQGHEGYRNGCIGNLMSFVG